MLGWRQRLRVAAARTTVRDTIADVRQSARVDVDLIGLIPPL